MTVSREEACPFVEDTFKNQTMRLEHTDLSLRELGINSKSKVLMSHRLTCSPLNIEKFVNKHTESGRSGGCLDAFLTFCDWSYPDPDNVTFVCGGIVVAGCNGPNGLSSQHSGQNAALANRPSQLEIWPNFLSTKSEFSRKLHPDLQRHDGEVFVVTFRAGKSSYNYPVDDPMFSAHEIVRDRPVNEESRIYFPDYDTTGIGCVEQYRFCVGERCTPWGREGNEIAGLSNSLLETGDLASATDLEVLDRQLVTKATVQRYLFQRRGTQVLLAFQHRVSELIELHDSKNQWIIELQSWFETAFLQSRYMLYGLLQRNHLPLEMMPEDLDPKFKDVCNRVLFYDGGYTNFDFIQFLVLLISLLLICAISFEKKLVAISRLVGRILRCGVVHSISSIGNTLRSGIQELKSMRWSRSVLSPNRQHAGRRLSPRNLLQRSHPDSAANTYTLSAVEPTQH